jgi:NHS family xanthosine MFS transporter
LVWDDEVGRNAVWSCFWNDGIASFMPTLTGIIADRWINAENYMERYIIWSSFILYPQVATPETFIYVMLLCVFYMPTIALSNSILLPPLN